MVLIKKICDIDDFFLDKIDIISGSSIGAVLGCVLIIPNEEKQNTQ